MADIKKGTRGNAEPYPCAENIPGYGSIAKQSSKFTGKVGGAGESQQKKFTPRTKGRDISGC